jgi:cardiolipin synthase
MPVTKPSSAPVHEPAADRQHLAHDAVTAAFSHDIAGHQLTFIPGGPDRLATLLGLIENAQQRLRIIVYIFEADDVGTQLRDAMVAAARRGVAVSLILDSFGSADTADGFFAPLVAAGGRYHWFGARWTPRYLIRNHLKLYIADDSIAMFGGFNISNAYFVPPGTAEGWHDLGVTISGADVALLGERFDLLEAWAADQRASWAGLVRVLRDWEAGAGPLRWLVGGPTSRLSPWARAVKRDIEAGSNLAMIMAYFSPGQSLLRRIGRLGRRARGNGGAQLILPAKSDNGATIGAARALYGFLLKRGVQIAEYQPDRLHLKLMVIDDIVYVGSANFDMRSLFINLELMLRVENAELAAKVRAFISAHQQLSITYDMTSHRQRATWWTRFKWAIAYFVVGAVDFGVTRRLNLGIDRGD